MIPCAWTNPNLDYINNRFIFNIKQKKKYDTTALEAAHNTIDYICKNYPPPYNLVVSGGIDSQCMIYSWYTHNQNFNIYSARYDFDMNSHDLLTLEEFSSKYNLKVNYIDFKLLDFLEQKHDTFAKLYLCGSPHFTTHMGISELIKDGTNIFSGNFVSTSILAITNAMGLYHYSILSGKSCIPFFLSETEEIGYSLKPYLENKLIDYEYKVECYKRNGFPVIRQPYKYTGFEKVKEYFDNQPVVSCDTDKFKILGKSTRNFDIIYRNKYEYMFSKHKYYYI